MKVRGCLGKGYTEEDDRKDFVPESRSLRRTLYQTIADFNPLPDMLNFFNSAAYKDMMSKIWINGDSIF